MIALDASRRSSTPHSRSWPNRSSRRSHNRSAARLARGERHAWFLCLGTGETWYLVGLTALPLSCAEATRAEGAADEVRCARGASAPGRQRARRRLQWLVRRRIEILPSARVCELPKVSHAKDLHTKFRGTASLSTSRTVADAERAASDASSGASPPRRSV